MSPDLTNDQIDRLLAEKLMGWEPTILKVIENGVTVDSEPIYSLAPPIRVKNWSPTRKIEQALGDGGSGTVVGKLAERGLVGIEIRRGCVSGKWEMTWALKDPGHWRVGPQADTPAEAICLAAAKALEVTP